MKMLELFENKSKWFIFSTNDDDTEAKIVDGPFKNEESALTASRANKLKNVHIGSGRIVAGYLVDIWVPYSIIGPKIKIAS